MLIMLIGVIGVNHVWYEFIVLMRYSCWYVWIMLIHVNHVWYVLIMLVRVPQVIILMFLLAFLLPSSMYLSLVQWFLNGGGGLTWDNISCCFLEGIQGGVPSSPPLRPPELSWGFWFCTFTQTFHSSWWVKQYHSSALFSACFSWLYFIWHCICKLCNCMLLCTIAQKFHITIRNVPHCSEKIMSPKWNPSNYI